MTNPEMLSVLKAMAADLDYMISQEEKRCPGVNSRMICIDAESTTQQQLKTISIAISNAPEPALYEIDQSQGIALRTCEPTVQSRAA